MTITNFAYYKKTRSKCNTQAHPVNPELPDSGTKNQQIHPEGKLAQSTVNVAIQKKGLLVNDKNIRYFIF